MHACTERSLRVPRTYGGQVSSLRTNTMFFFFFFFTFFVYFPRCWCWVHLSFGISRVPEVFQTALRHIHRLYSRPDCSSRVSRSPCSSWEPCLLFVCGRFREFQLIANARRVRFSCLFVFVSFLILSGCVVDPLGVSAALWPLGLPRAGRRFYIRSLNWSCARVWKFAAAACSILEENGELLINELAGA